MSADESRPGSSGRKLITRVELPPGPAAAFRDFLYELYLRSGPLNPDEVVRRIDDADAEDPDVLGVPRRDVIHQMISGKALPVQLNDAVTVARLLARAAGTDPDEADQRVRQLLVEARMPPPRLGQPVGECDPFELEVHRAIAVPERAGGLPVLPPYVPRTHDLQLADAVAAVTGGQSRLVVLVGGSSTGKTRACWEAVQALPGRWRLWHPIDPTRPEAAVAALAQVGAETVVWLNEAQHYLLLPHNPGLGEQVAAGLRTLLHDPSRRPVLVLATLWPQYWDTLTTAPVDGSPDPYGQARQLLAAASLRVPDAFTDTDLQTLHTMAATAAGADPRLALAVDAREGRVTQQLAGVPALIERYTQAGPVARAVIDVAIDARRLGHPLPIPHALLEQAAPGYLTDHEWNQAGDDWLEQALAYTAKPCNGVPGPLTRIRPRPGQPATGQPHYRLADYLEQTGGINRAGILPPAAFWNTAARVVTDSDALRELARQAARRGRYARAVQLYQEAADRGDTGALRDLAWLRAGAGDAAGAGALLRQAAERGDTGALWDLARLREAAGDAAGAEALALQVADRGDTGALWDLAWRLEKAGDTAGAEALLRQAADRGDTDALWDLAWRLEDVGDTAGAEALLRQAADRGDTDALRSLAWRLEDVGGTAGPEALARRAVDRGDTYALRGLARLRAKAGDAAGAEALAPQAADRGDTGALRDLALRLEDAGDTAGAEALLRQAVDRGDTYALRSVARLRAKVGDAAGAEALALQAADRGDTGALWDLAWLREKAGDAAGADRIRRFGLTDDGHPATSLGMTD